MKRKENKLISLTRRELSIHVCTIAGTSLINNGKKYSIFALGRILSRGVGGVMKNSFNRKRHCNVRELIVIRLFAAKLKFTERQKAKRQRGNAWQPISDQMFHAQKAFTWATFM